MSENETVIIEVQYNTATAVENVIKLKDANENLKQASKELKGEIEELKKARDVDAASIKALAEEIVTNEAKIKRNNEAIRENSKIIESNITVVKRADGSLKSMREETSKLQREFESLSKTEREGEVGMAMAKRMADLNDEIRETTKSFGSFKDNIGNYEGVVKSAMPGMSKLNSTMGGLGITAGTTAKEFGVGIVNGIKEAGLSMKALMANPLILGIHVILTVIQNISKAIKGNQEAMDALNRLFAPFQKATEYMFASFGKLIGEILKGIEWVITGVNKLIGKQKDYNDTIKEGLALSQKLRQQQINDITAIANEEKKMAELKDKIAAKDKFTAKERKEAAEALSNIIIGQGKREKERAEMALKAYEAENTLLIKNNMLTNEQLEAYETLKAAVIKADTNMLTKKKEATAAVAEAVAAINAERNATASASKSNVQSYNSSAKAFAEAEAKKREEIKRTKEAQEKTLLETARLLEDHLIASIKSERERQEAELIAKQDRERQAWQERLRTDETLTTESRKNINDIILMLEKQHLTQLDELKSEWRAQDDKIEKAGREEKIASQMQTDADAFELQMAQREVQINDSLQFEKEAAIREHVELNALSEEAAIARYGSIQMFELLKLQSNERIKQADKDLQERSRAAALETVKSFGNLAGAMSDLFGQMAGQSKALATFQKIMAMAEIMTNMGVAISGAVKGAMTLPFPANVAAVVTGTASVVSGIASAIATLKKSNPDVAIPKELQKGTASVSTPSIPSVSMPTVNVPTTQMPTLVQTTQIIQGQNYGQQAANSSSPRIAMPDVFVKVTDIQAVISSNENKRAVAIV